MAEEEGQHQREVRVYREGQEDQRVTSIHKLYSVSLLLAKNHLVGAGVCPGRGPNRVADLPQNEFQESYYAQETDLEFIPMELI